MQAVRTTHQVPENRRSLQEGGEKGAGYVPGHCKSGRMSASWVLAHSNWCLSEAAMEEEAFGGVKECVKRRIMVIMVSMKEPV